MATKRPIKANKPTKNRPKRILSVKRLEHIRPLSAGCGPKTTIYVTNLAR